MAYFIQRNKKSAITKAKFSSSGKYYTVYLTSSSAPTVFRQAFIVDMKFEVVGEDTSSLASFRKLLTVILSGMMARFGK